LATAPPTPQDVLPTLDNWLGAVTSLPLRSPDPSDLYPAPFLVRFNELTFTERPVRADSNPKDPCISSAALGKWEYAYVANEQKLEAPKPATARSPGPEGTGQLTVAQPTIYEKLLAQGKYDFDTFWADAPLVWRRHGRAPMIQSLPLTQTAV